MVFVGTSGTKRTVPLHVGLACRAVGIEAKAILASEKVAEAEAVRGLDALPLNLGHGCVPQWNGVTEVQVAGGDWWRRRC